MPDQYAMTLAEHIVALIESSDTSTTYVFASGMRRALEIYLGADAARELLFSLGHEY